MFSHYTIFILLAQSWNPEYFIAQGELLLHSRRDA
jgi:hypothetical protein